MNTEAYQLLLEINTAITKASSRAALLKIIFDKAQPIFGFYDVGLFIFSKDGKTLTDWAVLHQEISPSSGNKLLETQTSNHHTYQGSAFEKLAKDIEDAGGPVYRSYKDHFYKKYLIAEFDQEAYDSLIDAGYDKYVVSSLEYGGELSGFLFLNYWGKTNLPKDNTVLLSAISTQLTIAINNILANEQLLEEKQLTEKLLEISNALVNVSKREQISKVVVGKIGKLLPMDDLAIVIFNEDKTLWKDISIDKGLSDRIATNPLIESNMNDWLPMDSFTAEMLTGTSIWTTEDYKKFKDFPEAFLQSIESIGLKEFISTPLRISGEAFGFLVFDSKEYGTYSERDFPLFQAIADQLAIAVSNVLANENIAEREQFKSLQAGILSAFETSFEPEENFETVAKLFQDIIPFDMLAFSIYDGQSKTVEGHGYRRTGRTEYQYIDEKSFLNILNLNQDTFIKSWKHLDYTETQFFNSEAFLESLEKDGIKKVLHKKMGFQSSLISPINLNQERTLLVTFFSLRSDGYNAYQRDLVDKIVPSIRLAMDRILAFRYIQKLSEHLKLEKDYLKEELKTNYSLHQIVGSSDVIQQVFAKIDIVKNTETTVLISGETGTGKELVARAVHDASTRKDKTLVKINCATLPRELVESELFGHEKGAFTGALKQRIGKFELAHGGSIFLDEIGELPLELQTKLLRVIQEKEFDRLGGNGVIKTDVRIIAATNRNLEKEVAEGRFRSDLYFRLSVFPIHLPPLRERTEDIEALAYYFLEKFCRGAGKKIKKLSTSHLDRLKTYEWPGNIRELEHVMERSVLMSSDGKLHLAMEQPTRQKNAAPSGFEFKTMLQAETDLIYETLKRTRGKVRGKNGAAEILDLPPSTLQYRMKRAGITKAMVIRKK